MKKKYIALIMIVMAACFGTLALPSPAAKPTPKPAADTTVSAEYLQQIEQQNQRILKELEMLDLEQRLTERIDKKTDRNLTLSIGLFGALITFLSIFVPMTINKNQEKRLDETARKLDETAKEQKEMARNLDEKDREQKEMARKLDETAEKSEKAVAEAQKSANEAKALTYFAEALKEEDLDRQIELYTKSLKFGPNYAKAYNNRGITYNKKGEHDNAIKDYDKAIEINPELAEVYNNRGNAKKDLAKDLEAEGKTPEALAHYKAAVEDYDQFLKLWTQDDKVRKNAIRLKQECEEAIRQLEGGDEIAEATPLPRE